MVDEGILRPKEPFGYVDQEDQIQFYTVADLMEKDLVKTQAMADACLNELDKLQSVQFVKNMVLVTNPNLPNDI